MGNQLEQDLQKIGLSEKEAKVYLAGLELGPATAQQLAAKATVNRPTTYIMIESLIKRGLMSSFIKGKKKYFLAASPSNLGRVFDEQIEVFEKKKQVLLSTIDKLKKNNPGIDTRVMIFEGKDGISAVQQNLLEASKTVGSIINIAAVDAARKGRVDSHLQKLWNGLKKNKLHIRTLYTKVGPAEVQQESPTMTWEFRRLSQDIFPFKGEISVYGNHIAAIEYSEGKESGILIQSQDIADTIRTLFELAWSSSKSS